MSEEIEIRETIQELVHTSFGDGTQPWDKQPGESDKAYAAFFCFIRLDPSIRTKIKVAEIISTKMAEESGKTEGNKWFINQINRWAKEHNWDERAGTYDAHCNKIEIKSSAVARALANNAHSILARNTMHAISTPLQALRIKLEKDPEALEKFAKKKGVEELVNIIKNMVPTLEKLVDIERKALGVDEKADIASPNGKNKSSGNTQSTKLSEVQAKARNGSYK